MTVKDLLSYIPSDTLVSVEDENENVVICSPAGQINEETVDGLWVISVYPEAYGKYYNAHGITIVSVKN